MKKKVIFVNNYYCTCRQNCIVGRNCIVHVGRNYIVDNKFVMLSVNKNQFCECQDKTYFCTSLQHNHQVAVL